MSYTVEYKIDALIAQDKLTQGIKERIINKINWLSVNFESITHQSLTSNLHGLFKLRIGDYRVLYSFNDELGLITIHLMGHRSEIYD